MRTRLHGRPPASPPVRRSVGIPAEEKGTASFGRVSAPKKSVRSSKVLPSLICAAVLAAGVGLAPRISWLEKGVLLSTKLTLALPLDTAATMPEKTTSLPQITKTDTVSETVSETASEETEPEETTELPPEENGSNEERTYAPISMPEIELDPVIPEENKAVLVHKTYTAAPSNIFVPLEAGFIKNCTSHSSAEILAQVENPPYFTIEKGAEPQVLIMHTHTTESYLPFTGDYYDTTLSTRSTDNSQNMASVGEAIAEKLSEAGIGVLHDTTQHDHPSYNGSYDRSAVTVQEYLDKYPSIKVVLDIHRDAIISGDTVTAPVVEEDGQTAAQVMIISGCDNGNMNYPDYMKNLSFAAALQVQMETDHPGFTRPILFDYRKYNQHLTTGSLLIEVGSHGNTLEQALLSGEWIGESLGKLLNGMRS